MLFQDRDALCYALVTDMCGCARDKAFDRIGFSAAERAAQTMRAPFQQALERRKGFHIPTTCSLSWIRRKGFGKASTRKVSIRKALDATEGSIRPFLAMLLAHGGADSQLAGVSSSSSW
jgi:hypothetical protein